MRRRSSVRLPGLTRRLPALFLRRAHTESLLQTGEDSDGLTHEQVHAELQKLNPSITKEQASALTAQVDKDTDGCIQIDEFLEVMRLAETEGALPQHSTAVMKKRRESLPKRRRNSGSAFVELTLLQSPELEAENKKVDQVESSLDEVSTHSETQTSDDWFCGH